MSRRIARGNFPREKEQKKKGCTVIKCAEGQREQENGVRFLESPTVNLRYKGNDTYLLVPPGNSGVVQIEKRRKIRVYQTVSCLEDRSEMYSTR